MSIALACAPAADSTYTVRVPAASRIEAPALTWFGNWEVTVSFDPEHCEISCAYRMRSDRFGREPLAGYLLPHHARIAFGPVVEFDRSEASHEALEAATEAIRQAVEALRSRYGVRGCNHA